MLIPLIFLTYFLSKRWKWLPLAILPLFLLLFFEISVKIEGCSVHVVSLWLLVTYDIRLSLILLLGLLLGGAIFGYLLTHIGVFCHSLLSLIIANISWSVMFH